MRKLIIILSAVALSLFSVVPCYAQSYSRLLKAVAVDKDLITFADCNGFTWQYYTDDVELNDYYSAVFEDMDTQEIFDDVILSLHYERLDLFN